MKVLVACEESQEVCKAFRALGHEAYSCDIQECSGDHPEWHIKGDVLDYIYPDVLLCSLYPDIADEEDFMCWKVDGKTALLNIEKEIKAAPTIIQAEEGE